MVLVHRTVFTSTRCSFETSQVTISSSPASSVVFSFTCPLTGTLALLPLEFVAPESASYTWVAVTKDLWHACLGHIGESAVRTLAKSTSGIALGDAPFSVCEACIKGKHPRSPHPASSSRALQLLDLLHSDICGPFPVRTPHSKLYFIIFMDDCSHALDLHLLASRDQAWTHFASLIPSGNARPGGVWGVSAWTTWVNSFLKPSPPTSRGTGFAGS